jgi:hypothetical protein
LYKNLQLKLQTYSWVNVNPEHHNSNTFKDHKNSLTKSSTEFPNTNTPTKQKKPKAITKKEEKKYKAHIKSIELNKRTAYLDILPVGT